MTMLAEAILNQLPGYMIWKDLNSRYIGGTKGSAKLFGFSRAEDLIGITDYDLKCPASESADLFRSEDKQAIASNKKLTFLGLQTFANDLILPFLGTKEPLYDEKGELQGTLCIMSNIQATSVSKLLDLLDFKCEKKQYGSSHPKSCKLIADKPFHCNFTEKETEVLYHLLKARTTKEIALIMGRSARTIEFHIDNLKSKTGSTNKADLILYAIDHNFLNFIPSNLIKRSFSIPVSTRFTL